MSRAVFSDCPSDDFCAIASAILPPHYSLSIVLIGDRRARTLNRVQRGKDSPANILSFPLSDKAGEIFLNLARIRREAHRFDLTPHGHIRFLLIHGCLHLAGHHHGSTMEEAEDELVRRYKLR